MSLKAKIEAVIYASEEPVTLAQLAGLLGQEAQAELDHRQAAQRSLRLDGPADPLDDVEDEPASPEELNAEVLADEVDSGGAAAAPVDEKQAAREERARAVRLREHFRGLLEELVADYARGDRGLEIREVAGGYRLATKPEYHDAVRGFVRLLKPPLKLSLQALETLAVVAYKQPVTAPEISEIRGVDSGGVLGSLMTRKLITTAGRKQVIGRPILYKTTKDFLLRFGLRDVSELPSIEEFEKMAGELADVEPVQEEMAMSEAERQGPESVTGANLEEEREAVEPQADGDSSDVQTVPVDGRMSGLVPAYDDGDSSGAEARVQEDAQKEAMIDPKPLAGTPDSPADHEPDTVATPEGDNEFAPDQPLKPAPEGMQRTPEIDTNDV